MKMALTEAERAVVLASFLFQQVEAVASEPLLAQLEAASFAAGEEIYSARSFRRAIAILTDGAAIVRKGNLPMNELRVGDCFGVAALFNAVEEYASTVQAKTAATLVFISDTQLTALFARCPQSAVNYIAFLSCRIDFLNRKIAGFTAPTVQAGLCRFLAENAMDGVVTVWGGYAQLARRLNVGRASLYRSLEGLEENGTIRRVEKKITILKPEILRALEATENDTKGAII